MKKTKSFKLSETAIERYTRLAQEENTSQAHIIEKALEQYELNQEDFKRNFMELWEKLNDNIEKLQIKRDYTPDIPEGEGLNEEESQTLDFYFKLFDEMRKQPFYSEVVPPELSGGA